MRDSYAVIDAFLRDLPGMVELPRDRILLIVDGFRYHEVAAAGDGSYFDLMRKALLAKATAQGYEAIDLDPLFLRLRDPRHCASTIPRTCIGTAPATRWPPRRCCLRG